MKLRESHITLVLHGPVPSKKNLLRPKRSGGLYLDRKTSAEMTALVWQAKNQWGQRPALVSPSVSVVFHVRSRRSDRDNRLTCILDALVTAGVLANDNIENFNGPVIIDPAIVDPKAEEMTLIRLAKKRSRK